jgi:hypothetical protein
MADGMQLSTPNSENAALRQELVEPQVLERGDPAVAPQRPVATETRELQLLSQPPLITRRKSTRLSRRALKPLGPDTYAVMVRELKAQYKISIRKWRSRMSGVAYELKYLDGRIKRLITAPRPRSPVSAAIFLHEVGHHAIGFRRYAPRCLEEYYVWQWAFREMTARNIPIDQRVMRHYRRSMYHYVRQAKHQGAHGLPHELHAFHHWPG